MSLTRAGIEAELVGKLKGILVTRWYQLSILTNGSNPDLNGPIRRAVRSLGGTTADPLTVADADLAGFTGWQIEKLIDSARLEVLKDALNQIIDVDVTVGDDTQALSQLTSQLQARIAYLEQRLIEPYGQDLPPVAVGVMNGAGIVNDPLTPGRNRSRCGYWPYP